MRTRRAVCAGLNRFGERGFVVHWRDGRVWQRYWTVSKVEADALRALLSPGEMTLDDALREVYAQRNR